MSIETLLASGVAVVTKTEAAQLFRSDLRTFNKKLGTGEGKITPIDIGRKQLIPVAPLLRLLGIDDERSS